MKEKTPFAKSDLEFMDLIMMKYKIDDINEVNRPIYAEFYTRIGNYLCEEEHYNRGIYYLKKSLSIHPENNPMPHFLLGQAYIRKDNWEEGLKHLELAKTMHPQNKIFQQEFKDAYERYKAGLPPDKRKE